MAKKVVALRYRPPEDTAPVVVAKGQGFVADRILELAREAGVAVREDRDLVQILSLLDLEQTIPADSYRAVAEILSFLYRVNGRSGLPPQRKS